MVKAIANGCLDHETWDGCLRALHLSLDLANMKCPNEMFDMGSGSDPDNHLRNKHFVSFACESDDPVVFSNKIDELVQEQHKFKVDQNGREAITNIFADENDFPVCMVWYGMVWSRCTRRCASFLDQGFFDKVERRRIPI